MRRAAIAIPFLLAVFTLLASDLPSFITGSKVSHDQTRGELIVENARISAADAEVQAGIAHLSSDAKPQKAVRLSNGVTIATNGTNARTREATYYPESGNLIAASLTLDADTYTCSDGILHRNGVPVPGNSTCIGSARLSCSETFPNQVVVDFYSPECRLEPEG